MKKKLLQKHKLLWVDKLYEYNSTAQYYWCKNSYFQTHCFSLFFMFTIKKKLINFSFFCIFWNLFPPSLSSIYIYLQRSNKSNKEKILQYFALNRISIFSDFQQPLERSWKTIFSLVPLMYSTLYTSYVYLCTKRCAFLFPSPIISIKCIFLFSTLLKLLIRKHCYLPFTEVFFLTRHIILSFFAITLNFSFLVLSFFVFIFKSVHHSTFSPH